MWSSSECLELTCTFFLQWTAWSAHHISGRVLCDTAHNSEMKASPPSLHRFPTQASAPPSLVSRETLFLWQCVVECLANVLSACLSPGKPVHFMSHPVPKFSLIQMWAMRWTSENADSSGSLLLSCCSVLRELSGAWTIAQLCHVFTSLFENPLFYIMSWVLTSASLGMETFQLNKLYGTVVNGWMRANNIKPPLSPQSFYLI